MNQASPFPEINEWIQFPRSMEYNHFVLFSSMKQNPRATGNGQCPIVIPNKSRFIDWMVFTRNGTLGRKNSQLHTCPLANLWDWEAKWQDIELLHPAIVRPFILTTERYFAPPLQDMRTPYDPSECMRESIPMEIASIKGSILTYVLTGTYYSATDATDLLWVETNKILANATKKRRIMHTHLLVLNHLQCNKDAMEGHSSWNPIAWLCK